MSKKRRGKQARIPPPRKKEPKNLSHLTNKALQQKLIAKYPTLDPFPKSTPFLSFKHKIRIGLSPIFISPFVLLMAFGARHAREGSLLPVFVVMVCGQIIGLLFLIGHRPISQADYDALTPEEQQCHLLYDSFWDGLTRSGFGLYATVSLIWGVVEISISQGQPTMGLMLVGLDIGLVIVLLVKQRWFTLVLVEGLKKHKMAGQIWAGLLGLAFVIMGTGGALGTTARVTANIDPGSKPILTTMFLVGANLSLLLPFVWSLSGLVITKAYYQQYNRGTQ